MSDDLKHIGLLAMWQETYQNVMQIMGSREHCESMIQRHKERIAFHQRQIESYEPRVAEHVFRATKAEKRLEWVEEGLRANGYRVPCRMVENRRVSVLSGEFVYPEEEGG
jgi:hypothetical protein